jgi:signal peptidase I
MLPIDAGRLLSMFDNLKTQVRENIEAFAIAVLGILFINIFIVQSFIVKGPSMDTTLQDGERLWVTKFNYKIRPPKMGDIIVLKYPKDPSKKFIKRVIGIPGDRVYIQNSKLYVNGNEIKEPYIKEKMFQDYDYVEVPERTVFVMGDNRNCSKDSRDPDVGFVPYENLVGRAIFIFWPLPKGEVLARPKYPNLSN